jgi:peptidoglycan/LPS O-acetylase OafA/YrhL
MLAAMAWRTPATRQWLSSHIAVLYSSFGVLFIGMACLWKWFSDAYGIVMQGIGFTWIAMFFTTLLLVVLVRPAGLLGWTARMPWLRELGKVSYCMYIIHEAVNLFSHVLLLKGTPQILNRPGALTTVIAAVLTYAIARMSWILFENPLLRYGHRFQYGLAQGVDQSRGDLAGISASRGAAI